MRSSTGSRFWLQQLGLSVLYVAGAWVATRFVTLPDDLVLIWPPAGLSFGVLLLGGLHWWPFIPAGALLTHALFAPVPALFIPFSMASNTIATIASVLVMRRLAPARVRVAFTPRAGFLMLIGGLVQAVVSAAIGSVGLVLSGMVPPDAAVTALLRWSLADLFGLVVVGPFVLSVILSAQGQAPSLRLRYPGRAEQLALLLALLLSLSGQWLISRIAPLNALVLSFLPAGVLMWSALRMPPIVTTALTLVVGLMVAGFANFGAGGFVAPSTPSDIAVLLIFLSMLAIFPLTVAASHQESRLATAELVHRACTDRLTGLPNRVAFETAATAAIADPGALPLALAYVDVDQFKLVNDTLGHAVGDQFVQGLAGVLKHLRRPTDMLARIGGDEFAVLLRQCEGAVAERWCADVVAAVEQFRFGHTGHVLGVTASIGLVPLAQPGPGFQEAFARADAACFAAKELGGNRVLCSAFSDTALADREAAMRWAMRLSNALEAQRFELYFQRIVPLQTSSRSEKLEVLLRLREDSGELLLPGSFIPAVERFSMSSRLDRHVFERVLSWFESHPMPDDQSAPIIAINLSAASLADQGLARAIEERLTRSALPASRICFEITETGAVRDLNLAREFILRMQALGSSVALDDFGAGYCSFAYLRQLPVDVLKIDGSFVRELPESALAVAVVRSMVDIARTLHMHTVAECVEDESVRRCLIDLGVDYAQGFALHVPQPLERLLPRA